MGYVPPREPLPLGSITLDTEIEVDWDHHSSSDESNRLKWRANLEAAGLIAAIIAALLWVLG